MLGILNRPGLAIQKHRNIMTDDGDIFPCFFPPTFLGSTFVQQIVERSAGQCLILKSTQYCSYWLTKPVLAHHRLTGYRQKVILGSPSALECVYIPRLVCLRVFDFQFHLPEFKAWHSLGFNVHNHHTVSQTALPGTKGIFFFSPFPIRLDTVSALLLVRCGPRHSCLSSAWLAVPPSVYDFLVSCQP